MKPEKVMLIALHFIATLFIVMTFFSVISLIESI